jgi:tRNA-uridine 2-sulfurtransferase
MPIFRAKDTNKDQTYFLWQIKKKQLDKILLPVGEFQAKSEVRKYANSKDLITSTKPDSQGLCFVGQTSLREMLLQTLGSKNGSIVTVMTEDEIMAIGLNPTKLKTLDTDNKTPKKTFVLGEHEGAFLFTIGQRQNLGLSNGPWFVSAVDVTTNIVTVCHQNLTQELDCSEIIVKDCNWQLDWEEGFLGFKIVDQKAIVECQCQVRYRSKATNCQVIFDFEGDKVDYSFAKVIFVEPVRAVAIGQSAVFYTPECQLLGGGFIESKN